MSIRHKLGELAAGIGATALFLIVAPIFLFAIPLSVITLMRWFEWEWWTALVAVILIQIVPGFGQLAALITTVAGAYYFISVDFSWEVATNPNLSVLEETLQQNRQMFVENITNQCEQDEPTFKTSGVSRENYSQFCLCLAEKVSHGATAKELSYQMKHGKPSPDLTVMMVSAFEDCRREFSN